MITRLAEFVHQNEAAETYDKIRKILDEVSIGIRQAAFHPLLIINQIQFLCQSQRYADLRVPHFAEILFRTATTKRKT